MDYKESYIELLETNKRLVKELELIRSKSFEDKARKDTKIKDNPPDGENAGVQKMLKDVQNNSGLVFEKFADLLPEMVYEVDLTGKILYANRQGMSFFGYSHEDLERGVYLSEIFPERYQEMIENLKALTSPGQISSNEYYAKKRMEALSP